jgi:septal ring factor EnvC (AmiA/AmiB activator)
MEQRLRKVEKEVAVLESRVDTSEQEISTLRTDIKALSSKMDKTQGILLAAIALAQSIGILLGG